MTALRKPENTSTPRKTALPLQWITATTIAITTTAVTTTTDATTPLEHCELVNAYHKTRAVCPVLPCFAGPHILSESCYCDCTVLLWILCTILNAQLLW